METKYLLAIRLLLRGHKYLAVSFYRMVMANKTLTAFIISMLLNIHLFVSLAQARIERDQANHRMTKFYNFHE